MFHSDSKERSDVTCDSVLDFEMIEYRHTPARHLQHVLLV